MSRRGFWLVLAAAVLWGTTGTAQALAPAGAQPAAIGALRLAIGGITLLGAVSVRGGWRAGRPWPLIPTIWAAAGMAAYQLCFFAALSQTGVAVGTVVTIGSAPILTGMFTWVVRGERPTRRWLMATMLAVAGCSILVIAGESVTVDTDGILLALLAGTAYAVSTIASKVLLDVQEPDPAMAAVFCLGALFLSPILFTSNLSWLGEWRGMVATLHLGVLTVALAYALFARGLVAVPVATAVTLALVEPLTAAALGVLLLEEHLTLAAAIGVGLLLAGLILLSFTLRSLPPHPQTSQSA